MAPSPEFLTQHAALTQGVGVADVSDRTRLDLRGSDRVSFLHAFCTNDIKQLVPGRGCEAFITSPQGKTLGHVLVFCEPERLLLDTSPGKAQTIGSHFNKYVISEDVEFVDRTEELGSLLIAGPLATQTLKLLSGNEPPAEPLSSVQARIAGSEVVIRRVEYADAISFFLQVARSDVSRLITALLDSGAVLCGPDAVETARIEAGFPLFGRDITDDNLPQEVGRDATAISFTKGCYLGQETVARIDALGHVNRSLVGLKFASSDVPAFGSAILTEGKDVGHVTSAIWSPILNAPLAMGYVRRVHARPGTLLATSIGSAEVMSLPVHRG
jgi:folate-binding protein YgfZ